MFKINKKPTALCVLCAAIASVALAAETESEDLARARAANQARDFATSLAIYRAWSARGSGAASTNLGLMYWSGTGLVKDHQRACDLFAEAEKRSDPNGTELLGDCYFHGDGRPQDYHQSVSLRIGDTPLGALPAQRERLPHGAPLKVHT